MVVPMSSKEGPPVLKGMLGPGRKWAGNGGPIISELTC